MKVKLMRKLFFAVLFLSFSLIGFSQIAVISINNSGSDTICPGSTLTLSGNSSSASVVNWAWVSNPSAGITISPDTAQQNINITFSTAGSYTLSLFVTDAVSTEDTFRVIEVKPTVIPSVSISSPSSGPICEGDSMLFVSSPLNQGISPVYSWTLNQLSIPGIDSFLTITSLQNNDTVIVSLISSELCASPLNASDTFIVQANPNLTPLVSILQAPAISCEGDTLFFTATIANGGTNPTYQWQLNGVSIGSASTFSSDTLTSSDELTLQIVSTEFCLTTTSAFDTLNPSVQLKPLINVIQGTDTVCPNDSLTFIVSSLANATFLWQPGTGVNTVTNDTVNVSQALEGSYEYTVISEINGCTDSAKVSLHVINRLAIEISIPDTICLGDSVSIFANGGLNYLWTSEDTIPCATCDTIKVAPQSNSTYYVMVTQGGCSASDSVAIVVDEPVVSNFSAIELDFDNSVIYSFENLSQNAELYSWNFGDNSPLSDAEDTIHAFLTSGTYSVTLVAFSTNSCPNDTSVQVLDLKIESSIEAPNVFSPNGDEINETFYFITKGITKLTCTIYDRWGVEIANLTKPSSKWDGRTTSGLPVVEGTYFYVMRASGFDNKEYNTKGFIKLLR